MPEFAYEAIRADGHRHRGREDAASVEALTRALEARGAFVLDVHATADDDAPSERVARAAVADMIRALAALLAAGLPISRAIAVVADTSPTALARVLNDVRSRVERGESVATACAAHPAVFDASAVGVVRAGERAGDLDRALARLATQLERDVALRARLQSAAIYPIVLAIAGTVAVGVLMLFVLPRFAALLEGTGLPVPRSTALLLGAARTLRTQWWLVPTSIAALVTLVAWLRNATAGRRLWSQLLLHAPVIRGARREALAGQTARTLAVLLRGGIPIATALATSAESVSDASLAEALRAARSRVLTGSTLHAALRAESIFTPVLVALIATGEEAGRLVDFLERAAQLFEDRTERAVQRVVALIEPAMIVLFGGVIGVIALSLLQAIYGINPSGLR